MLFNLLLSRITKLLCFFLLFFVVFNRFLMIPVVIENAILKLALTILTGDQMAVVNDVIEMLPAVTDKAIYDLPK